MFDNGVAINIVVILSIDSGELNWCAHWRAFQYKTAILPVGSNTIVPFIFTCHIEIHVCLCVFCSQSNGIYSNDNVCWLRSFFNYYNKLTCMEWWWEKIQATLIVKPYEISTDCSTHDNLIQIFIHWPYTLIT